jgi:DHA1 family bicyclomycin/chloramphenicol resistance-like MFS transporter
LTPPVKPSGEAPVRHNLLVLATLSLLMGFASISTDFYLPALPAMAISLRASSGTLEYTVSGYLIGFSVGQLFWGPIGDRHGRRVPVGVGLVLFMIGSAGCALAGGAASMIGWRLVQAVGACAGVVLARAMVRDLYAGHRAAQMLSTLLTVMAIAPLVGPLLGAQIMALAGWRAIFWTLVGVGVLTFAALFLLPDTLPPARRNAYMGAGGFYYAGTFAYVAGSPFAFITYHHVPPRFYGVLFGAGIIGIMATNAINARIVRRLGGDRLLLRGTAAAALAGIVLAVDARTGWGGLVGLVVPVFLYIAATGFIVANAIAGAMAMFPERAGAVSALVGSVQYGGGILGSALVGALADDTPWPMGLVIALCGLGALLCARLRGAPG